MKNKDYDYEKIIKNIYRDRLNKEPSKNKHYDFIPLKERKDYGEGGLDFLEQQALDLKEEGKLPKDIEKKIKRRIDSKDE